MVEVGLLVAGEALGLMVRAPVLSCGSFRQGPPGAHPPHGLPPHVPSGPSPGGALSHLASHCCVAGGRRASEHSRDGWPVWPEQRTARC